MNRTSIFTVVCAVVCAVCASVHAEYLYLTLEDGVAVVLNTNHTWQYRNSGASTSLIGKPVNLDDGSTIVLKKDKTWGFVYDASSKSVPSSSVQSLYAVGMAQRTELSEAHAVAMEEAMKQLARQLGEAVPGMSGSDDIVLDCVKAEEKDVETGEEQGKLWKVTVKLGLDETGVRNVIYCVEKRRARESAPPDGAE